MKKLIFLFSLLFCVAGFSQTRDYTFNRTSSNNVDSVYWDFDASQVTVIQYGTATDTMYVSMFVDFPEDHTYIFTPEEGLFLKLSIRKFYYKFGYMPTAGIKIKGAVR